MDIVKFNVGFLVIWHYRLIVFENLFTLRFFDKNRSFINLVLPKWAWLINWLILWFLTCLYLFIDLIQCLNFHWLINWLKDLFKYLFAYIYKCRTKRQVVKKTVKITTNRKSTSKIASNPEHSFICGYFPIFLVAWKVKLVA